MVNVNDTPGPTAEKKDGGETSAHIVLKLQDEIMARTPHLGLCERITHGVLVGSIEGREKVPKTGVSENRLALVADGQLTTYQGQNVGLNKVGEDLPVFPIGDPHEGRCAP
ncbi:hypothetical protein Dalu01_01823 [Deinococcus aluminii]|uniref:Uncharacterized protein n=1 Tax=Deinococcus aluminii TaxID=1656885 RepID=A0ABP9XDH1_9DEIO